MAPVTLGYAVLMIALGLLFYFQTQATTALIPAYFGVPFLVLGLLARNDHWRKHAMHAASALGLVALIAALVVLIVRREQASPTAAAEQAIMAVLSLVFVGLCVRSFIMARRARAANSPPPAT